MGKNKKTKMKQGGDGKHSPNTVFVSNLPYTFTQTQLEEAFSEVGPIRRCFMVTKKGSNEHQGFGFVQFAVTEDASRSVELKNGSSIGGRKVRVKSALQRAPLEQRRPKENQAVEVQPDGTTETKDDEEDNEEVKSEDEKHDDIDISSEAVKTANVPKSQKTEPVKEPVPLKDKKDEGCGPKKQGYDPTTKEPVPVDVKDKGSGSDKQRVARTVIFGGLLNAKMAESVHLIAKECGDVLAVDYPLPKGELDHHGLSKEGCKVEASSVLFRTVKSARECVATLHQRKIDRAFVWARQLGGEGSKTQKWKLIIRNLPFEANISDIRNMFSTAGFVWDVFVPQNSETGLAKGFAFVKFTCKQHAESAIKKFNGQKFGKRTVAVDWAVPKKVYLTGALSAVTSDDEQEAEDDIEDNHDSDDIKNDKANNDDKTEVDPISNDADMVEEEENINFDEEADVARKVLQNLISSSTKGDSVSPDDGPTLISKSSKEPVVAKKLNSGDSKNTKIAKSEGTEGEEELQRTIFITNLPFEVDKEEVKQRFSAFGEVQSFVPVLHQVTKRPRGTGFLKFKSADAVDAAYSAADSAPGVGIILKGRQLKVFRALDKKSAHNKEQEKVKKEVHDHRNLYLAKEGLIVEATPAAEGVSATDMSKRQELQRSKETKLKSPNFHVSRTRLIIYNLPKSMNDKELKKLFIDAVTSRATKQKPVIKQIKFMKDLKNGKAVEKNYSRGVAFLEFTEHQHALVALRVLNNNPEVFGSEHRPIVEFALDNIQKLKLREERNQKQEAGSRNTEEKSHQRNDRNTPDSHRKENPWKGKLKGDDVSPKVRKTNQEDEATKDGSQKENPRKRKLKGDDVSLKDRKNNKKENRSENKFQDRKSVQVPKTGMDAKMPVAVEKVNRQGQKRKLKDRNEQDMEGTNFKKSRKSKKDKVGRDVVDKLDMLIEKYKNKFSHNSSDKNAEQKQGPRQLKRWYEA